jgi:putative ABC transport system permease protein
MGQGWARGKSTHSSSHRQIPQIADNPVTFPVTNRHDFMLRNYLTIALRHLRQHKIFSILNIMGLAIGLACCILISLYVWSELHYDTYAVNADRIYRVEINLLANNGMATYPSVDVAVGQGMAKAFPQVKGFTRLFPVGIGFWSYGNKQFKEDGRLAMADPNFLSFFSLGMIRGNAATALSEPNTMVISRDFAKKFFGEEEPIGKQLKTGSILFKVTGVMENMPDESHFHFDAFLSMPAAISVGRNTWSNTNYWTYLQLGDKADPRRIEAGMPALVAKYVVPEVQRDMAVSLAEAQKSVNTFRFFLQPLRDIHLRANSKYEIEHGGDIEYVYIFSALAIFILLLACVNFTNLSTAIASKRAREVGIRKVMGSLKRQLVAQFLAEAGLLSLISLFVAIGLVLLLLPYFNQLSGKHFSWRALLDFRAIATLLLLALVTGFCAGGYPAFFLSSFNVINVLKGAFSPTKGKTIPLRSGLVVFQFFVSTSLIIATLIIYRQLQYMQNQKLGYDKDQVLYLQDTYTLGDQNTLRAFRQQLVADSRVVNASLGDFTPGREDIPGTLIYPKDKLTNGSDMTIPTNIYWIDYDYIPTLGMKIIRGRNFSRGFPTDSTGAIINEAAVRDLGWSGVDPIGKTIIGSQREYRVVGVVADFNYVSLKQKIAPLMMTLERWPGAGMIVKVKTGDMAGFLIDLQQRWRAMNPQTPFSYYFVDDKFAALYSGERKTAELFRLFAILSIIIACLGLFGLAAFSTEQRAKEIGIRKVLGASVQQVMLLVAKEFLVLIGIAFLLAAPVTWWAMHTWLTDFAYRTQLSAWIFLGAGFATALIALVTISSRTLGAALTNPVNVLRSE